MTAESSISVESLSLPPSLKLTLPKDDAGRHVWVLNFRKRIAANPDLYKIQPTWLRELNRAVDAYDAAYQRWSNHVDRTEFDIHEKNARRDAAIAICRKLAAWIKAQPTIAYIDKLKVGFKPGGR